MSGGHYDYLYSYFNDLADKIEQDLRQSKAGPDEWGHTHELTEAEYSWMEAFRGHLVRVSDVAKELEWWRSGDTDSSEFLEKIKDLLL